MIVSVDYRDKLLEAYKAGAAAQAMFALKMGPKPDAEEWLDRKNNLAGTVARL